MIREVKDNQAMLIGEIISNFEFSHKVCGEGFYVSALSIERKSATRDLIPITVSDRLIEVGADWTGRLVKASGQFRSYNKHERNKSHLILSVFAREFEEIEFEHEEPGSGNDKNKIYLDGYICKPPSHRKTPLGREIADILLAVNRQYGKSDYIPCIAWGRNARFASGLGVGTRLQIEGRIQSRVYQKQIEDGVYDTRTAYEVSISKLTVVEETEG